MSRYIDADDAVAKYAHYGIGHCYDATDLEEILDEMPSIDIVFCKDCKHFIEYKGIRSSCVFHLSAVNADDFCSYGERSSE